MAGVTLNPAPQSFPPGTSVVIKVAPTVLRLFSPGSGEPPGTTVATVSVETNGTLPISGLNAGTRYVGWANVGGVDRYLQFGPLGTSTAAGIAPSGQPEQLTVKTASVELRGANPGRTGLEVVNTGAKAVRVMLGEAGKAKYGILLAANGGAWNGLLGGATWTGSVFAICDAEETTVAVTEV